MISIRREAGADKTWNIWTVGIEGPATPGLRGDWLPLQDCDSIDTAMAVMSYLNGGTHPDLLKAQLDAIREEELP